jgi:site-specific recombinase XerD
MKASSIGSDYIQAYVLRRQEEGVESATINRELAALRRMFSLGVEHRKVVNPPRIKTLNENNVRSGFFEHADFLRLRDALPEHVRPVLTV